MKKLSKKEHKAYTERRRVQVPALQTTHEKAERKEEGMRVGGGEKERDGGARVRGPGFFLYLQNLQIAQRSESSIFDAADVVAVQLPAPSTQTHTQTHTHTHT